MQSCSDARLSGYLSTFIHLTWLVLTILNLAFVKPKDGRKCLSLNQSKASNIPGRWQDMFLMLLNFVYWLEGVCFCSISRFSLMYWLLSRYLVPFGNSCCCRNMFNNTKSTYNIILKINYLLRCPNSGRCQPSNQLTNSLNEFLDHVLGKLVIQDIIPTIDLLRWQFRATFSSMFTQELLFSCGVIPEIEAGHLERSNEFFNSITYK